MNFEKENNMYPIDKHEYKTSKGKCKCKCPEPDNATQDRLKTEYEQMRIPKWMVL